MESLYSFDCRIRHEGYRTLAGADEAGRGPWAGPVVAAVVIMPAETHIPDVNDSKKLTPAARDALFSRITASCTAYSVGIIEHTIIDRINILNATFAAFKQAFDGLSHTVDLMLIDGTHTVPGIPSRQRAYINGDSLSYSIACASIIAKVTRDRIMEHKDREYPGWGFARHKGYGTRQHRDALRMIGVSPIHRRSYNPVKELLNIR